MRTALFRTIHPQFQTLVHVIAKKGHLFSEHDINSHQHAKKIVLIRQKHRRWRKDGWFAPRVPAKFPPVYSSRQLMASALTTRRHLAPRYAGFEDKDMGKGFIACDIQLSSPHDKHSLLQSPVVGDLKRPTNATLTVTGHKTFEREL